MGAKRETAMAMKARATRESGDVSREQQARPWPQRLDRVIHDRTRLAILAALAATETLSFTDLKTITGTTDGNLSVHARKLEDAGYALCREDVCRPHPADGIPAERGRPPGVREVSRSHGRAHQGDAEKIDRPQPNVRIRPSTRSMTASGVDVPAVMPTVCASRNHAGLRSASVWTWWTREQ